jgi:hypothetical protein
LISLGADDKSNSSLSFWDKVGMRATIDIVSDVNVGTLEFYAKDGTRLSIGVDENNNKRIDFGTGPIKAPSKSSPPREK